MSEEDAIKADILKLKTSLKNKHVEQVKLLLLVTDLDPCEPLNRLEIQAPPGELVKLNLYAQQENVTVSIPYPLETLTFKEFEEVLDFVKETWQISEIRAANMESLATMIYEPGLKSIRTRIDKKGRMLIYAGKTRRFLQKDCIAAVATDALKEAIEAKCYAIRRTDYDVDVNSYYGERCTHQSSCNCMRCCR